MTGRRSHGRLSALNGVVHQGIMESLTRFLEGRMRLKVNRTKSAVDRPWKRTFLGYTVTTHFSPRLKPAPASLTRAKDRIRHITHAGRGRNSRTVIDEVNRFTRGWVGYCRLATVTDPFDKLDQWIRRRLRKILWEQWKKPKTRCRKMGSIRVSQRHFGAFRGFAWVIRWESPCGSSWKTRSVFQGAVGAFCASTVPSASTGPVRVRQDDSQGGGGPPRPRTAVDR